MPEKKRVSCLSKVSVGSWFSLVSDAWSIFCCSQSDLWRWTWLVTLSLLWDWVRGARSGHRLDGTDEQDTLVSTRSYHWWTGCFTDQLEDTPTLSGDVGTATARGEREDEGPVEDEGDTERGGPVGEGGAGQEASESRGGPKDAPDPGQDTEVISWSP